MPRQRLRYKLIVKEGHDDRVKAEGWTWINEPIPFEFQMRWLFGLKITLKGRIETTVEDAEAPIP